MSEASGKKQIIESFETSASGIFGDMLNYPEKKKLKVGVYTAGWFEFWRLYPELETYAQKDADVIVKQIQKHLGTEAEIVWPGLISTHDEADNAGKLFRKEDVDLMIFVLVVYCSDSMTLQCLRYVEHVPLIVFNRQCHRDIDFDADYEQTLRNSCLIAATQLTGTFRKMGLFDNFKVIVGVDSDNEPYLEMKKYLTAIKGYNHLRELNVGIVGHVFRGMFDHEYDRTRIKAFLGADVIDIQIGHLMNEWGNVTDEEIENCKKEASWVKHYSFTDVTEEAFTKECRFAVAYQKLIKKFRLDGACYLGQHFVEVQTGCTGYLANILFSKEKKIMISTEGDVNGLIIMCLMNIMTGQTPLFAEWGDYGEKEDAINMVMHGWGDPDFAKDTSNVRITPAPENWGFTGTGLSIEYTAKPGLVTMAHVIDLNDTGWRMLITRGEALDVEKSIPCSNVSLIFKPEIPVKDFIKRIITMGVDHHAIICYGDYTEELSYVAELMGIDKEFVGVYGKD